MKFKMSPNSLFAILLRKPWWVSMAVGAVLSVVPLAVLPDDLKLAGAMGGIGFFILGLVALKRQWNAPSARQVEALTAVAAGMGWAAFSTWLEKAFARDGFRVRRLEGSGADLCLEREGRKTLIAARRWKAARHGEDAIQALVDAAAAEAAQECIYIALGELSGKAKKLARERGVGLMQGDELARLLQGVAPSAG